jgi:hypothetical protein
MRSGDTAARTANWCDSARSTVAQAAPAPSTGLARPPYPAEFERREIPATWRPPNEAECNPLQKALKLQPLGHLARSFDSIEQKEIGVNLCFSSDQQETQRLAASITRDLGIRNAPSIRINTRTRRRAGGTKKAEEQPRALKKLPHNSPPRRNTRDLRLLSCYPRLSSSAKVRGTA